MWVELVQSAAGQVGTLPCTYNWRTRKQARDVACNAQGHTVKWPSHALNPRPQMPVISRQDSLGFSSWLTQTCDVTPYTLTLPLFASACLAPKTGWPCSWVTTDSVLWLLSAPVWPHVFCLYPSFLHPPLTGTEPLRYTRESYSRG